MPITPVDARRAYYREWYAKNKEKARGYKKAYWERKARLLTELESAEKKEDSSSCVGEEAAENKPE